MFFSSIGFSQTIDLLGKVQSESDVENVHVINKSAQRFTTTNKYGEFKISVSLNDTLVFSSIQHKLLSVLIDQEIIEDKTLVVFLEEQVNELDQVVVGKVLTGDIMSDVGNVEGEPMTSKKAGIPSYQGKPKTQSERRLTEATTGAGIIPLNPILNGISGRTKELKQRILLEEKETLMYSIKARLSEDLFSLEPLHDDFIMEYFYFVSEAEDFLERCKSKTDILILEYLLVKLKAYKKNKYDNKN
ncbi:hypothetical protein C1T31_04030 [Hanstruepera neustonica]|uniref:Carboxypeptidase-like regulatory domain-containing protein n=1 Tax=Hanstruepera neustonica TaxID=1445657 RepID=A0A2K1E5A8_9FLAO|nr:hypothetical protein C1T31_04030 [Hanstruepera neustonica]